MVKGQFRLGTAWRGELSTDVIENWSMVAVNQGVNKALLHNIRRVFAAWWTWWAHYLKMIHVRLFMGHTCYMSSALQCISNIPEITEYFLSDRHFTDINEMNPLGTKVVPCLFWYLIVLNTGKTCQGLCRFDKVVVEWKTRGSDAEELQGMPSFFRWFISLFRR